MDKDPNIYSVIILILLFSSIILGRRWIKAMFRSILRAERTIFLGSILLCIIIFFTIIYLWGAGAWLWIIIAIFVLMMLMEIMGLLK